MVDKKQFLNEFDDPGDMTYVFIEELKKTLQNLQQDLMVIKDPQVRGFAEKKYIEYKSLLYNTITADLELGVHMDDVYGDISQEEDTDITES